MRFILGLIVLKFGGGYVPAHFRHSRILRWIMLDRWHSITPYTEACGARLWEPTPDFTHPETRSTQPNQNYSQGARGE